jgi:hypothetical protein
MLQNKLLGGYFGEEILPASYQMAQKNRPQILPN